MHAGGVLRCDLHLLEQLLHLGVVLAFDLLVIAIPIFSTLGFCAMPIQLKSVVVKGEAILPTGNVRYEHRCRDRGSLVRDSRPILIQSSGLTMARATFK